MNELAPTQPLPRELAIFDISIMAGNVSSTTIEQYRIDFRQYLLFAGEMDQALNPATLARWRQHVFEMGFVGKDGTLHTYSVSRINRMLASVRSVMREAAAQGYIPHATADGFRAVRGLKVTANKERRKANARTKITREQMVALCYVSNVETAAGLMHRALMLTLASSGVRISEAISLTQSQVELCEDDHGRIGWVIQVAGKNLVDEKPRALGQSAKLAIDQWLAVRQELGIDVPPIFTGFAGRGNRPTEKPITRQGAWAMIKRYAKEVGLVDIKPHDFRRYVGTELAKVNLRLAQNQLGHKRIETTAQNYVLDEVAVGVTDELV